MSLTYKHSLNVTTAVGDYRDEESKKNRRIFLGYEQYIAYKI
jgi:hypothetical protein